MQQNTSRMSYNIDEIANMRSISEQAVLDDIYHGQLKAHIWLPMMVVEEMRCHQIGEQVLYARHIKNYEGYLCLHPQDVRKVMKFGKAAIRSFEDCDDGKEIVLTKGSPDYCVEKSDLIILKDSLCHVKLKTDQRDMTVTAVARLADIIPDLQRKLKDAPSADASFYNVTFKGKDYAFGILQADILKQLYKAAMAGDPKVHFKRLFVEAGSQSVRMRDVFKSQPDWRDLICNDYRGYYWLDPDFIMALHTNPSPL